MTWNTGRPPNVEWVTVICYNTGKEIKARAIYGSDGVRPHWEREDGTLCEASAFKKWKPI